MSSKQIQSFDALRDDVQAFMSKKAGHSVSSPSVPEKDPTEAGQPSIPVDADANPSKQHMPTKEHTNATKEKSKEDIVTPLEMEDTSPTHGNPSDGVKADEQASSLAASANKIAADLRRLANQKEATATHAEAQAHVNQEVESEHLKVAADMYSHLVDSCLESQEDFETLCGIAIRHKGEKAASELIANAVQGRETLKTAYEKESMEHDDPVEETVKLAHEVYAEANQDLQEEMEKFAAIGHEFSEGMSETEKLAFVQGAQDMAEMTDSGMMGGAEGEMTIEDIVGAIELLVQSGEIDEDTAGQLLELLAAELGGEEGGEPEALEGDPEVMGKEASANEAYEHFDSLIS